MRWSQFPIVVGIMVVTNSGLAAEYICAGPERPLRTHKDWEIFFLHQKNEVFRHYDKDCDGVLTGEDITKFTETQKNYVSIDVNQAMKQAEKGQPPEIDEKGNITPEFNSYEEQIALSEPAQAQPRSRFLLRNSYEDIGVFDEPKSIKEAGGAEVNWARDGIKENDAFGVNGIATYMFSGPSAGNENGTSNFLRYTVAPSILINRFQNTNRNLKSGNIDILSFGVSGEVGFRDMPIGDQYFRIRSNYNTNFRGAPESWSVTGEWRPIYTKKNSWFAVGAPKVTGPLAWRFDPSLRMQYTESLEDSDLPLFADGDGLLRIGPSAALIIQPVGPHAGIPKWLGDLSASIGYTWLYDVYGSGDYDFFTSSINVPFDKSDHIALRLSYQKGQLEETGQRSDLAKVGLSVKW